MTIKLEKLERYAYGPMQFSSQSVDDMRVGDMLDFVRDIPTISNDISAISKELLDARSEIEQLNEEKDRLAHALAGAWEANSKHKDEIEQLKAETKKLKESDRELKEEIKYILHNCQPLSVLSTQEKLHWVTCSINMWSKLK